MTFKNQYFRSLFTYEFLALVLLLVGFNFAIEKSLYRTIFLDLFWGTLLVFAYHHVNYFIPEFLLKRKVMEYAAFVLMEAVVCILGLSIFLRIFRSYDWYWSHMVVPSVAIAFTFSIAYAIARHFLMHRYVRSLLTTSQLQAEIKGLQNQINPHFYFNALNHLYGTALEEGSQKTANAIQEFSSIMRHMTEEGGKDFISTEREFRFLQNYIEFQKERLPADRKASIKYKIESDDQSYNIPPLLLVNFIENAFKHGISAHHDFFIHIFIYCRAGQTQVYVDNSKHHDLQKTQMSGIGLENVKRRLELLYPGNYTLDISDLPDTYKVSLKINLKPFHNSVTKSE